VPEEVKQERLARFMAHQAEISSARLQRRVGRIEKVLIDKNRCVFKVSIDTDISYQRPSFPN
jgi:tRNA A37 methylthiotransferase MiaB